MGSQLYIPTPLLFGAGVSEEWYIRPMPGEKAMLVFSAKPSASEKEYLRLMEIQLQKAGIKSVLFRQIQEEAFDSTVMEGKKVARDQQCDFIIALGNSTVINAGKAIAAVTENEGEWWDYVKLNAGKKRILRNKPLPVIAVPSGFTGFGIHDFCITVHQKTQEKVPFQHSWLFPDLALIDSQRMDISSIEQDGVRILFSSMDSAFSRASNPMGILYAKEAIGNLSIFLPRILKNKSDWEAIEAITFAGILSELAVGINGHTGQWAIAQALSNAHPELSWELGMGMISRAYYTRLIGQPKIKERFLQLAGAFGGSNAQEETDFLEAFSSLLQTCQAPDEKMSEYRIVPSEWGDLVDKAMQSMGRLFQNDYIPLDKKDYCEILEESYK